MLIKKFENEQKNKQKLSLLFENKLSPIWEINFFKLCLSPTNHEFHLILTKILLVKIRENWTVLLELFKSLL